MPSSSGITMSSRTTSHDPARRRSSASRPFSAVPTSWPDAASVRASSVRFTRSSSTTRIEPVAGAVTQQCRRSRSATRSGRTTSHSASIASTCRGRAVEVAARARLRARDRAAPAAPRRTSPRSPSACERRVRRGPRRRPSRPASARRSRCGPSSRHASTISASPSASSPSIATSARTALASSDALRACRGRLSTCRSFRPSVMRGPGAMQRRQSAGERARRSPGTASGRASGARRAAPRASVVGRAVRPACGR